MNKIITIATGILVTILLFVSCKKEVGVPILIKQPPIANAGADLYITLPTDSIELRGLGTDADGTIVSYEWTKVSGPSQYAFVNSDNAIAKAKNLVEGRYGFQLKVTDNSGLSAIDLVLVFVEY